jgi:two-component system chemotaxis response regulator CheY
MTTEDRRRVLAVDDSASMRKMVAFTLGSVGITVAEANDGAVALQMARQEQFALLLIDVNMPRLNGIALVKSLRGLPGYQFVPLLMLTTETAPARRRDAVEAGATGWLVKPFSPDQLIATVRRVMA